MSRSGRRLGGAAVAALVLPLVDLGAGEARACSPNPCPIPLRAPAGSVPANALAIPLYDATTVAVLTGPAGTVTLRAETAPDGSAVLRPTETLSVGLHVLTYDRKCQGATSRQSASFDVVDAAPPPTTLGRFAIYSAGVQYPSAPFVEAGVVDGDPNVSSYFGLIDYGITVDGEVVSSFNKQGAGVTLRAYCPSAAGGPPRKDSCGAVMDVATGPHTVKIQATVAGIGPLPAVTGEVNLDCAWVTTLNPGTGVLRPIPSSSGGNNGALGGADGALGGATGGGKTMSVSGSGGVSGSAGAANRPAEGDDASSSGCSVATGSANRARAGALAAVALSIMLVRRRRIVARRSGGS